MGQTAACNPFDESTIVFETDNSVFQEIRTFTATDVRKNSAYQANKKSETTVVRQNAQKKSEAYDRCVSNIKYYAKKGETSIFCYDVFLMTATIKKNWRNKDF